MNIFNSVCFSLLLLSLTDADTYLTLNGTIVNSKFDKTVIIYCLTEAFPFECGMEFLHNNSTAESIRYSNGGCYDTFGKCKPGICSCSGDCKSFHWNFTSTAIKINDSFGCKMRIYNSTSYSFYKVYTSAAYNETGFISSTSVIYQIKEEATTAKPTPSISVKNIAVCCIILAILLAVAVLVIIILLACSYTRKKKERPPSAGSNCSTRRPMTE